ncbi:putative transmembrane protein [Toxoplasma gondii TgCatPRC2]|uniref:Transmembrane protein n=13 Tax=Toxoplasma gondii TaxID=5811 RepID=A0A125YP52_TOXGV|nr:hypothetical protein TGME49_295995 [Toxoplasma gondii ME49]EPR57759.1 hypothetical protein TGGT1_295995 [Toxoplasma gondii GT1]ESS29145.1 putative transmembrane protein [Toxoplasma gondii VEG]KAF4646239.1 hypothetical protein TGRH88_020260 [Toxoplasma gondii]KFG28406.1 putative transmembrane protein [Toxoplasma gondii p89]KFG36029.1 putative transmembrane protein [Toxoplasma gondii FOU]KFG37229.1 putative transmembrane protein [Toxoplasma gondii GAB2-2007-GAL-DOM2]KFG57521.1 putative tran|eukprot:XP_018638546.1 hypothetical protein TGME49_295995 [Toxoplasma gondii ME49]
MEEGRENETVQVYSCDTEATSDTIPPQVESSADVVTFSSPHSKAMCTPCLGQKGVNNPSSHSEATENQLHLFENHPGDVEAQALPNGSNLSTTDLCQATAVKSVAGQLPTHIAKRLKSGYVPYNPFNLSLTTRQLLEFTELPFMILWVYLTYFVVIVALTAPKVRKLVWVSAVVAGALVGVGLNANAYRAIMYRGYPDVGMIVRFFLIPFGVSALSGLTNSLRDRFMLVFPKDPVELIIAVVCPTVVVCVLMISRILILRKHRVPITLRNFFLNGRIYY